MLFLAYFFLFLVAGWTFSTASLMSFAFVYFALVVSGFFGMGLDFLDLTYLGFLCASFLLMYRAINSNYELEIPVVRADLAVLVGISIIIFMVADARVELRWDEYSHWGHSIKFLTQNHILPSKDVLPIGNGAPWYPMGLAAYSTALGFGFTGISPYNYPILLNFLLLCNVVLKFGNMFAQNNSTSVKSLTLFSLIIAGSYSYFHSGYADFALNMCLILFLLNFMSYLNNTKNLQNLLSAVALLVIITSLKESGKYMAVLAYGSVMLIYFKNFNIKFIIKTSLLLLLPFVFVTYFWSQIVSDISSLSGREIGLWTLSNLEPNNSIEFIRSAIQRLVVLKEYMLIVSILLIYSLIITYKSGTFLVKDYVALKSIKVISLIAIFNFIFVIASFYLTFGVQEFRQANSFERYTELSFIAVVIVLMIYIAQWPNLFSRARVLMVLFLMTTSLYSGWFYYNKLGMSIQEDVFPQEVAGLLNEDLQEGDTVFYIDVLRTQGLHPIKINWFLPKSRDLHYAVQSLDSNFKLPSELVGKITHIMVIDQLTKLDCYGFGENINILNRALNNSYGVFYAWSKVDNLLKVIRENDFNDCK